jgi:GH35 family endo-1,4-beta-xylanase
MTFKKLMIAIIFLGLSACGNSEENSVGAPPQGRLEALSNCNRCPNRITSHGIVFTEMDPSTKDFLAAAASDSHTGIIRMDLTWASLQPSAPPSAYDWHWADESIQAARKNNLEILVLIAETPAWASSNPISPNARFYPPKPEYLDTWAAFIKAFVDRYGAKGTNEIHAWEIWGEANDDSMWKGSAAEYARLYSRAYDAIKASDPTATVLMAGMNESKQPNWLNAVLTDASYPARNKIDVIDVHIRGSVNHIKSVSPNWKEAFRLQGVQNKPVWVTEFGFPSSPTFQKGWDDNFVGANEADGEQKQADYYNAVIPWMLTNGGIDKIFVTLRDVEAPGTPWESEGILTKTGNPKVAFNAIRALSDRFNTTAATPAPTPAPPPRRRWR